MTHTIDSECCSFKVSEFNRKQFEQFAAVLVELGIEFNYEISATGKTANVTVTSLPDQYEAQVKRTRNAGRPNKPLQLPKGSIFNNETTCAEFLAWLEEHSTNEAMEQLGLSRATYFRRLKTMREKVEWERIHNPKRVREGIQERHYTLSDV